MFRFKVAPRDFYADYVAGRHIVYLDINVWSDLTERRTTDADHAHNAARNALMRHAAVFPLAYATVVEILKRDMNPDSDAQIDFMDELSLGVCLRGDSHVRELEARCALEFVISGSSTAPVANMFTTTACYDVDREIEVDAAPNGNDQSDVLRVTYPTLRFVQRRDRTPEFLQRHKTTDEKYVREVERKIRDAPTWAADASGKLDATKVRFEEHTAALNNYIVPHLSRLVRADALTRVRNELKTLATTPTSLAPVIAAMPSIWLSCEMHVHRILAGTRRTCKQDFYDHEHAARAIPYVSAFVTSDRGLLDVLRRAKVASRYPCQILAGLPALSKYLASI
jgi:hypothetical protein